MALLEHTPRFGVDDAVRLAREFYGLSAAATILPSDRDQNFLLTSQGDKPGERYVLKIANGQEDQSLLLAQQEAMTLVAAQSGRCPSVVPTISGETLTSVARHGDRTHFVWLVTYLPGVPLAQVPRRSQTLLADLGYTVGQIDRVLAMFDHPALHRDFQWDLVNGVRIVQAHSERVTDPALRRLIGAFAAKFERTITPRLAPLRRSAIHNDANDYNVLVRIGDDLETRYQKIQGLVDFGDIVHSLTVNDLAIAIAYVTLDKLDPLAAAAAVVRGYHAAYPLQEEEVAVLWDLARLRLCVSVCLGAYQQAQRPDDPYLSISQLPIRRTFDRLLQIPGRAATAAFRHACGWAPSPAADAVSEWLRANANTAAPVLDRDFFLAPPLVLDLSVSSPLVEGDPEQRAGTLLQRKIREAIDSAGTTLAVGRYDEVRLLQTGATGAFHLPAGVRRNVHLGLDLFAPAGSRVYAPLDGTVHALAEDAAPDSDGPAVLLRHETAAGEAFYARYGRLDDESVARLRPGQTVRQGEPFAVVGAAGARDPLPPHLHLQLILDNLGLGNAFPSLVRATERALWCRLSPNPNLILGIPAPCFPPSPPDKAATLSARRRYLGRNLSLTYREPIKVVRGWMQYLYDENGRRYLDAYNNVPHVGHCHPRVVAAGRQQMGILNTNTRYLHDVVNHFAARLCATLPDPLGVCYFVNSGSEANELALRLARAHTGQRDMIVLEAAYHGHTNTLVDISPYKHEGPGGSGPPSWVHVAPLPDLYRGRYREDDEQAGQKYAQHVQQIIAGLQARGRGPAGFIAESLPSVGGQIVLPDGYLPAVYRAVRAAGGVCIADEVQTAYGRVGTHFYGFAMQGIVPDIVVLGKPIGNGHPLAAVVTTPTIAASFDNGMEFFSTFGGNTVSCAVGLAVLEVVQENEFQAHALRVGTYLLSGLESLRDQYSLVGDVRGSGLFLGVELVRDRETRSPAGREASFIADRMRQRGILLGTEGPAHNVLKIRPPMPFTAADADFLLATLQEILASEFA